MLCIIPMEGYLTQNKVYEVNEVLPEHSRISVVDDNGRECHANKVRFTDSVGLQPGFTSVNILMEDFYVKVIEKWKDFWMNQKQHNEDDRQNYFNRAFGIDANMKYHLANLLREAVSSSIERTEIKSDEETSKLLV